MRLPSTRIILVTATLAGLASASPAGAQMVLPGAVAPTPAGTQVSPPAATPRRSRPRAQAQDAAPALAPAVTPAPLSLAGQTLFLNGRKSQITFAEKDKGLQVSRLVLSGTKPPNGTEDCQVEIPGTPLGSTDLGKPNGVSRIKIDLPACPIVFDVLEGAVLAVGDPPSCDFPEKTCRVNPAGLWGPQAGAIGPAQVKVIEHARAQAETAVRTNFKLLLTTTRDRPTISDYAREQAGFSSVREEICRDYAGEGRHGFCATRLTQARAVALRAKFVVEAAAKAERKAERKRAHARK